MDIKAFLQTWARLDLHSERNDRSRYPDGAYIDIEHHLLRLALVRLGLKLQGLVKLALFSQPLLHRVFSQADGWLICWMYSPLVTTMGEINRDGHLDLVPQSRSGLADGLDASGSSGLGW